MANQFEESETEEDYQEFESEEEHEVDEDENLILNIVQDGDEESDEEELMFVPNIRTATGGKHSDESSDGGDSSDESNSESGSDSVEHSETLSAKRWIRK